MAKTVKSTAQSNTTSQMASGMTQPTNQMAGVQPSHEQIARRAYEIFLERGGSHGNAAEDWIQAERELSLQRRS